jgi:hypothetical protein
MSSPAAGKFQDHYKILGIEPKSTLDTVQSAYNALKAIYDPSSGSEPDHQKFEEITLALEVLSDPVGRKMFDSVRGGDDDREISFSGMDFFNSLQNERNRRMTMLCVLYDVRRQNPRVPLITMRQFEKIVDMTEEQIQLALWYVKTLGWVAVDDKSKMQITAQGMDFLQANAPAPADIWPFLKNPSGPRPQEEGLSALSTALQSFATAPTPVPVTPQPVPVAPPQPAPNPMPNPIPSPSPLTAAESPRLKPISLIRRTQVAITEA